MILRTNSNGKTESQKQNQKTPASGERHGRQKQLHLTAVRPPCPDWGRDGHFHFGLGPVPNPRAPEGSSCMAGHTLKAGLGLPVGLSRTVPEPCPGALLLWGLLCGPGQGLLQVAGGKFSVGLGDPQGATCLGRGVTGLLAVLGWGLSDLPPPALWRTPGAQGCKPRSGVPIRPPGSPERLPLPCQARLFQGPLSQGSAEPGLGPDEREGRLLQAVLGWAGSAACRCRLRTQE